MNHDEDIQSVYERHERALREAELQRQKIVRYGIQNRDLVPGMDMRDV